MRAKVGLKISQGGQFPFAVLFPLGLLLLFLAGCAPHQAVSGHRIVAVTTLYPQYDFVRRIGGDKVKVEMLLPPGVEPHDFEPRPRDIVRISQAALLIYTNPEMEPWVEKVLAMDAAKKVLPVNSSLGISMFGHDEEEEEEDDPNKHEHGEESHHHGHGEHGLDPHVWTDPLNAKVMVDNISRALQKVDPENAAYYSGNAENLKKELDQLHQEYQAALRPYRNRTIIYAGHFAFGYLAKRYGLEHLSPYEGFSPNAEPTPQKIIQLSEHLRKTGMKTIFIEELLDPKVGRIISKQTGAKMVLLHGIHNVTKEEMKEGVSYVSLMRKNLLNLKEAFHSAE